MDKNATTYILREIDKLRADQAVVLNGGGPKAFAEYRTDCGGIRGLTHAEQLVKDLVQKMEYSDD